MQPHTPSKWRCLFGSPAIFPLIIGFCITCLWIRSLSITDVVAFRAFRAQWQIASQDSTAYVERTANAAPGVAMLAFASTPAGQTLPKSQFPWQTLGFSKKSAVVSYAGMPPDSPFTRYRFPYWLPALVALVMTWLFIRRYQRKTIFPTREAGQGVAPPQSAEAPDR